MKYNDKFKIHPDDKEPGQTITLWHGSRDGIQGKEIKPVSALDRNGNYIRHDFGP